MIACVCDFCVNSSDLESRGTVARIRNLRGLLVWGWNHNDNRFVL